MWEFRRTDGGWTLRVPVDLRDRQPRPLTNEHRAALLGLRIACQAGDAHGWASARMVEDLLRATGGTGRWPPSACLLSRRHLMYLWRDGWVEKLAGRLFTRMPVDTDHPDYHMNWWRPSQAGHDLLDETGARGRAAASS